MTDSKPRTLEDMAAEKRFVSVPPNFDPAANPILAQHWYGLGPLHPIGNELRSDFADRRRQRQFDHVTLLGPRAVGELLYEVADGGDLDCALAAYERLTPALLKATGGDHFPPVPIHEVRR